MECAMEWSGFEWNGIGTVVAMAVGSSSMVATTEAVGASPHGSFKVGSLVGWVRDATPHGEWPRARRGLSAFVPRWRARSLLVLSLSLSLWRRSEALRRRAADDAARGRRGDAPARPDRRARGVMRDSPHDTLSQQPPKSAGHRSFCTHYVSFVAFKGGHFFSSSSFSYDVIYHHSRRGAHARNALNDLLRGRIVSMRLSHAKCRSM